MWAARTQARMLWPWREMTALRRLRPSMYTCWRLAIKHSRPWVVVAQIVTLADTTGAICANVHVKAVPRPDFVTVKLVRSMTPAASPAGSETLGSTKALSGSDDAVGEAAGDAPAPDDKEAAAVKRARAQARTVVRNRIMPIASAKAGQNLNVFADDEYQQTRWEIVSYALAGESTLAQLPARSFA